MRSSSLPAGLLLCLLALAAVCTPDARPPDEAVRAFTFADSAAGRPTVAVDPAGRAVFVAWTHRENGATNVLLTAIGRTEGPESEPVRVNDVPGDAAAHNQAPPQVAVAPDGTLFVAWIAQREVRGRRFPASDIRLARSTDGGRSFEPAVIVNEDAGFPTGHHFHNLAVAPDGTVFVSWLDSGARDRAEQMYERSGTAPGRAAAEATPHGHGGHRDNGLPGTELRVARSSDGGRTFAPGVVVAQGTCQCCRTALAAGPNGTVYVAWRHVFGRSTRDVSVARSLDGGQTFSSPVRVHADGWQIDGCPHSGPALARTPDGLLVAWFTGREGAAGVYLARSRDEGASFEPATLLAPDAIAPSVAAAALGAEIFVAWDDTGNGTVHVINAAARQRPDLPAPAVSEGKGVSLSAGGGIVALAWRTQTDVHLQVISP